MKKWYLRWGHQFLILIINLLIHFKKKVEVEKMRAHAQDHLMNKLAGTRHKAEEKRAVAEAKRTHAAARTAEQADYIRRTGRIPSTFFSCSCWGWCWWL